MALPSANIVKLLNQVCAQFWDSSKGLGLPPFIWIFHKNYRHLYNIPTRCNSGSIVFINNYNTVFINNYNTTRVATCWFIRHIIDLWCAGNSDIKYRQLLCENEGRIWYCTGNTNVIISTHSFIKQHLEQEFYIQCIIHSKSTIRW